jgi:RNA polymerase sigma-70 factor (ECF subfamily)
MTLVESMRTQMYRTALMQLHNEHDALDAVQEALIKAFQNIKNLKRNEFLKSWIIRILINECHNIQRYKKKIIPMEKESMGVNDRRSRDNFDTVEIENLLGRMDDIYKEIINLRYNHDLKLEEISEVLDIPLGTVKSRLSRAHSILKQQYLKEEEVSS